MEYIRTRNSRVFVHHEVMQPFLVSARALLSNSKGEASFYLSASVQIQQRKIIRFNIETEYVTDNHKP